MPYTVPNASAAAFADQADLFSADLVGLSLGPALTGVQSGCAVTAQASPNMTLSVAAGVVRIAGRSVTVSAGTVTITTAHATNPRIDFVVVDTSGTKSVSAGPSSTATVIMPDYPASSVVLYAVYVPAADTAISSNQLTDKRVFVADPGYENVVWYGAVGNDSTDNSTAFQAAIDSIPTAFPTRGRRIVIPVGEYRLTTGLTFSSANLFSVHFIGLGGVGANALDAGVKLKCNSASMVMFTFDAGASVRQNGPVFTNIAFDGATLATTTLVSLRMTNRARFENCSFSQATTGIKFYSSVDTVSGGDSSWHEIIACHFYRNTTSIECTHTYRLNIHGGDIVSTNTSTGIRIGTVGVNTPSQFINVFGMKIDGCLIGVDNEGGYCNFYGVAMEGCTTGFRVRHLITNAIAGSKNTYVGCSFGTVTTAFDVGTGTIQNAEINSNFTSVTNQRTFADAAAAANWSIIGMGSNEPGNLRLATMQTTAPADADVRAGQVQIWWDEANSALKFKGKKADSTVVTGTL